MLAPLLQRILVPLDGSALAEMVLPAVRALASATGAELVLAMVVEPVPTLLPVFPHPIAIESDDIDKREVEARHYLNRIKEDLLAKGLDVRSRIVIGGGPAMQIVRVADEEHCDIIAVATHGAGGMDRIVFGSVTDKLVRTSHVPVLVLRPTGNPERVREVLTGAAQ